MSPRAACSLRPGTLHCTCIYILIYILIWGGRQVFETYGKSVDTQLLPRWGPRLSLETRLGKAGPPPYSASLRGHARGGSSGRRSPWGSGLARWGTADEGRGDRRRSGSRTRRRYTPAFWLTVAVHRPASLSIPCTRPGFSRGRQSPLWVFLPGPQGPLVWAAAILDTHSNGGHRARDR